MHRWLLGSVVVLAGLAGCGGSGAVLPAGLGGPSEAAVRGRMLEVLAEAAVSQEAAVRCHALEVYGMLGAAEAQERVLKGLGDEMAAVRFAAALAAGDAGVSAARGRLGQLLRDESPAVQLAAGYGLEKLGDRRFGRWYDGALGGGDEGLKAQACLLLGKLGESPVHPDSREKLRQVMRTGSAAVKLQAAEALGRLGDAEVLVKLLAYANSGYADDRILAISGLGALLPSEDAYAMLTVLTEDPLEEVRLAAIRALGPRASEEQVAYVRSVLGRRGWEDAAARDRLVGLAALALAATGDEGTDGVLYDLLGDQSEYVRLAAAHAAARRDQENTRQ